MPAKLITIFSVLNLCVGVRDSVGGTVVESLAIGVSIVGAGVSAYVGFGVGVVHHSYLVKTSG